MRRSRKESESFCAALLSILGVVILCAPLSAASVSCLADSAVEETPEAQISPAAVAVSKLQVGISGVYKSGVPTRVAVSWQGDASNLSFLELETVDSDGTPFFSRYEIGDSEKEQGRIEARFVFPKANAQLTVRLGGGAGVVSERVFSTGSGKSTGKDADILYASPASSSRPVYLVLGSENLGFSEAFAELRWQEERRPIIVGVESFDELPTDSRCYEAFDKLFITTSNADIFDGVDGSSPKIRAIEEWVERGGSVVLFADEKAIPLLSAGGALANLSPGSSIAERAQEFRSVNALVTALQNVKNLAMTGSKSNPFLRVPVISDLKPYANVEMQEVETPLLVTRPVGLGSIIYFAGDLSTAPLANWSGRGRLMLKVLGIDPEKTGAKPGGSNFVKRGYVDLSGQVRSALDSFEGVRISPFSLVAGLIFAYLLVIAPLDWLIVKKGLKKPNFTWVTFPLFAIVFSVVAIWIFKSSTPNEPSMNQVDLIDVDMASGMTRDSSWFGFYSPVGERYEFKFAPGAFDFTSENSGSVDQATVLSSVYPLTLAGDGLGGAEQKSYMTRVWSGAYEVGETSDAANLTGAPLMTRSSKSFFGRWTGRLQNMPETPKLRDDGLILHGSILNPFDVPIYSAFIIFNGGAYSLGTLAPGLTKLERGMTRLEPTRALNENKSSVPAAKLKSWNLNTYNNSSTRLPYILRTASFYDFGGGEENFGISKRLQRDVDLSELLRCGRAVVYGTVVDACYQDYAASNELAKKSADALEIERLDRKMAAQRGETVENVMEASIEKYGLSGSSDEFEPTAARWGRAGGSADTSAKNRTVVVRLIVPMTYGVNEE